MKRPMTPGEEKEAIRAQVEAEMPTPKNFYSSEEEWRYSEMHEQRFAELCGNPSLWDFMPEVEEKEE